MFSNWNSFQSRHYALKQWKNSHPNGDEHLHHLLGHELPTGCVKSLSCQARENLEVISQGCESYLLFFEVECGPEKSWQALHYRNRDIQAFAKQEREQDRLVSNQYNQRFHT